MRQSGRMTADTGAPVPTRTLRDGHPLPIVGLGTFGLRGEGGVAAVASALRGGYRLLDTALRYRNEREVGDGLRASGVPREEVVVTSKLRGRHHGNVRRGLELTLAGLGFDRVDLYLIHWPLPALGRYVDTWKTMIELRDEGLIRSIGVSNFTPAQLTRLIEETGEVPAVNQVELHPRLPQAAQREFHERHGIVTSSWSPLGRIRDNAVIGRIARAHAVSPAQVVLRWHVQLGAVPIPKSGSPARQAQNLDVVGFELSTGDMAAIADLETGRRLWLSNPDWHYEF